MKSSQVTSLKIPNKWHVCKKCQRTQQKRQRCGFLEFSELPSLNLAGSRSGCFHTSLGCEPRSLIRVTLGWFDNLYQYLNPPRECHMGCLGLKIREVRNQSDQLPADGRTGGNIKHKQVAALSPLVSRAGPLRMIFPLLYMFRLCASPVSWVR
jgi:hypothetical protein